MVSWFLSLHLLCVMGYGLGLLHESGIRNRRQGSSGGSCQTPKGASGSCINIKQCQELLDLLQKRREPGVVEYLRASQCSGGGGGGGGAVLVCCPQPQSDRLPSTAVCGLSDAANNRVVNGRPAALGSWPWMVALGYRSPTKPNVEWLCGGTLITNQFVVTAAHCVTNIGRKTLYTARLGDLNLNDEVNDKASPVDIPIEKAIPHENYDAALHTVDIALIKLKEKVQFSKLIRPICLPTGNVFNNDLTGLSPFIIGWGATSYRGPSTTALQEAQIDISDLDSCAQAYKSIKGATIDSRVICAQSPLGKDACQGDSGGPLLLPKQLNFYLVGVVSYGYKCAEPGYPGIYTKVSLYVDWIVNNMV